MRSYAGIIASTSRPDVPFTHNSDPLRVPYRSFPGTTGTLGDTKYSGRGTIASTGTVADSVSVLPKPSKIGSDLGQEESDSPWR